MVMRIGGLASGMDIDSIVEKLMQAEKAPLNKLFQQKQKYEWQRDAYRDVNKQLKAFDDFLFPGMTLQKDFYKKTVASSNEAISATPTTAEAGKSLTINSVKQLATSANIVFDFDNSKKSLNDLGYTDGLEMRFNVGKDEVNLNFSATESMDDVVKKLKEQKGINVFIDNQSGKMAISSKATGSDAITNFSITSNANVTTKLTLGNNAIFNVNGAEIERDSNSFEIEGMKITLNSTYNVNGNQQPVTLKAKVDADNMVDKIKKFVETYNGLVDSLVALTKQPKYRDYPPLTDEQKEDMKEKEIEAWELKAKSGVLRGDQLIASALSSMRTTMYSSGGGKQDKTGVNFINTLYEMGITTTNKVSDNGKLEINEDKLRAAIEKDPDQVFKTFSDTTVGNEGIVQKLRKNIDTTVKNIEKKAGKADATNQTFNIGRNLDGIEDRINTWKSKLKNIEQRYWKQFSAMEQAINKANTQSSNLFSGQQ